jgi:hypothetical protein
VGYAGVEAAVSVSVQVRLLRNSQDSPEKEVERFLVVVAASPLQQIRLRHRFQTPLVLTEILHLIAILLTLVVEVVDLFVVLDANFSVAVQLIWVFLLLSILRRHVVSQIDVQIDVLRTMQI